MQQRSTTSSSLECKLQFPKNTLTLHEPRVHICISWSIADGSIAENAALWRDSFLGGSLFLFFSGNTSVPDGPQGLIIHLIACTVICFANGRPASLE